MVAALAQICARDNDKACLGSCRASRRRWGRLGGALVGRRPSRYGIGVLGTGLGFMRFLCALPFRSSSIQRTRSSAAIDPLA